jgi:hypothetical protein
MVHTTQKALSSSPFFNLLKKITFIKKKLCPRQSHNSDPSFHGQITQLVGKTSGISLYGAGNGGLSTERKDNPQQVACSEATIYKGM